MALSSTAPACPKCGTSRTRAVGGGTRVYHRCDACEYVFRPRHQPMPNARTLACPNCRSDRLRIVGQSGNPPRVHYTCDTCGLVSSRPLDDDAAGIMDPDDR